MRYLVLMRGAMGSGKSTWIKQNDLEQYAISPDQIRLMIQTPVMNADGGMTISMNNEKRVWDLLFNVLEDRMRRGEFTIIDATHSKTQDFTKYRKIAQEYRYRLVCVDFTGVPIEVAKTQNKLRESYKFVPEDRIDTLYERFKTQEVPSYVKIVKPDEYQNFMRYMARDFSNWKKIHMIGDLHGCNTALQEYLQGDLKDDELYIFCGDYIDRGLEHVELLNFLISIKDYENVIMLEGNHEKWAWYWANDEYEKIKSKEFFKRTIHQLEKVIEPEVIDESGKVIKPKVIEYFVDKKDIRQLYRKLNQIVYFIYAEKAVIVTHGGISMMPNNLLYIATEQFVQGVGKYEDEIDKTFFEMTDNFYCSDGDRNIFDIYQVHGHRNIQHYPVQVNERCFNLEGEIEMGGNLRVVTLTQEGFQTFEIKNSVVHPMFEEEANNAHYGDFVKGLKRDKTVEEKDMGNGISSFNFTRDAFTKRKWNDNNVKARGLFINLETEQIVARSYDKFFNIGERPETKIQNLSRSLLFPVIAYKKYNGYLGLVGYDSQKDELIYTSKSSTNSDHTTWLKEILMTKKPEVFISYEEIIKQIIKLHNITLVFEPLDPINDPHIIEYKERDIILLDAVYNEEEFRKVSYSQLKIIGLALGIKVKEIDSVLYNWTDFYAWFVERSKAWDETLEGYVIEDSKGFMTKMKLRYYDFWKHMRGVKEILGSNNPQKLKTGKLYNKVANMFYNWIITKDKEYIKNNSIIYLRNAFMEESDYKRVDNQSDFTNDESTS